jgi:hypothetical protein
MTSSEGYVPCIVRTQKTWLMIERAWSVQLDINGIYYIAFAVIVGDGEYTSRSVLQHTQNNTGNVLDFTYSSTTSDSEIYTSTSVQRSRLLLVRESTSLTCKLRSTDPYFDGCLVDTHPTFHGFFTLSGVDLTSRLQPT